MTPDNPTRDYWPIVKSMADADIGSWPEFTVRYTTVFLAAVFMTLHTEEPLIAVWLAGFLGVNGYYSWCLTRIRAPVSRQTYLRLTAMFVLSVSLYTSCAVYLFLQDTIAFKTVAIAALMAQAMFNLSRHRRGSISAIFDTVAVALAGLFFGLTTLMGNDQSSPEMMFVLVSTIGVCCYFAIAQYRNIDTHNSLRRARAEAIQTQKMQAVGQITAGVAHDFNNLLTVIRGNIELAELIDDEAERTMYLKDAMDAADRAADLTSKLLSFSRKARLEAKTVDVEQFWTGFEKILSRSVPAGIQTHLSVAPDLEALFCDQGQLENALLNLSINARDALNGSGEIHFFIRPASDADRRGIDRKAAKQLSLGAIEVRDNGPGIPNDLLSSVTEPFFTTKGVGKGSGLGLSMVKGFAEQSGGGLVISSDSHGTSVVMVLPTGPAEANN